jgi:hypothetical protein
LKTNFFQTFKTISIMDILDNQYSATPANSGLQVTRDMKTNWLTTSKWAMFFAILGFIVAGFSLLTLGSVMSSLDTMMTLLGQPETAMRLESMATFITVISVLGTAAAFFVSFFHFRFASGIQQAMRSDDQTSFETAWRNLRYHFRLNGILIITYLALYLIAIIFVASMAASGPDF